jgi:hypothetical protein
MAVLRSKRSIKKAAKKPDNPAENVYADTNAANCCAEIPRSVWSLGPRGNITTKSKILAKWMSVSRTRRRFLVFKYVY